MTKYYLHYVGKQLYSIESFMREASKLGVSRALPMSLIKSLSWGDQIMLAIYFEKKFDQSKIGCAKVFGYFTVESVRHAEWTKEMADELARSLNVVGEKFLDVFVERRCGCYTIGYSVFVTNSLKDIINKAQMIEERRGIRGKWFIEGRFAKTPEIVLEDVKFTRGLLKIDIDLDISSLGITGGAVVYSYNYVQRRYIKKAEKQMFLSRNLDNYIF
ncbi:MAG: hypothetical protein QXW42_04310 [Thermofilum sp.]